jgi:hypothetical protein
VRGDHDGAAALFPQWTVLPYATPGRRWRAGDSAPNSRSASSTAAPIRLRSSGVSRQDHRPAGAYSISVPISFAIASAGAMPPRLLRLAITAITMPSSGYISRKESAPRCEPFFATRRCLFSDPTLNP